MSWTRLILILLKRDLYPANDGSAVKRGLLHWISFYLLPTCGILILLFVIAFAGLWLAVEEQAIEHNLKEAKESPYMAIFAEGYLFNERAGVNRSGSADYNPERWKRLKLKELIHGKVPENLNDTLVFKGVYPFSICYLDVQIKNGEHLAARKGIAIDFAEPEKRNEGLIKKIKEYAGKDWRWKSYRDAEGIIISKSGLEILGWGSRETPPDYLWVRPTRYDDKIPLRVVSVENLPYYSYVLPMKEWRRIESGYYYKKLKRFVVKFPAGHSKTKEEALKKILPKDSRVTEPFKKGELDAVRVFLPQNHKKSRIEIFKDFQHGHEGKWEIATGSHEPTLDIEKYGGAMLYLNSEVLSEEILQLGLLQNLKRLFEEYDALKVRGELIHTLQKAWQDQQRLGRIKNFLQAGYIAMGLVLVIFFSIVLHTRLHRIGTLRMLGSPTGLFLTLYFIEGLIFVLIAFAAATGVFKLCIPDEMQFTIFSHNTLGVIGRMILFSEFGLLVPAFWFLRRLLPSEMISYRSG